MSLAGQMKDANSDVFQDESAVVKRATMYCDVSTSACGVAANSEGVTS